MSYEYHQLLKYVYFEGYADSYEEADYLLEQLSDEELCDLYENTSGGRARRASSRRAPIPQRVTDTEAREIRQNARENPKPFASAPEDDSREAMKARFKAETDAENAEIEAKKPKSVPSRGIGASERVLRKGKKRTPGGTAQARVTELNRRRRQQSETPYAAGDDERVRRISAALKKRNKWGTPEAAREEFVIDYLVTEGYTDNYDSAIEIYESMSDEWLDTILEVRGGGRVSFTGDTRSRGMPINPSDKLYRKKIGIEMDMEDEENRIRARNRAEPEHRDSGPHPEEEGDDTRSRRSKRKAARRDAAANREIETSPRMQRLQQRHQILSDVHDRLRYGR